MAQTRGPSLWAATWLSGVSGLAAGRSYAAGPAWVLAGVRVSGRGGPEASEVVWWT